MNELDNVVKTWEEDEASAFQNNSESKLFYEIKASFDPKAEMRRIFHEKNVNVHHFTKSSPEARSFAGAS